jgi:hypothetical protein
MVLTELSREEYNFLAVVVSFLLVLWAYKAFKQLKEGVRLRAAWYVFTSLFFYPSFLKLVFTNFDIY